MKSFTFAVILALLLTGRIVAATDQPEAPPVVLGPFRVVAQSVEMRAHYTTNDGTKTLKYVRVRNVAKGSMPDQAGLKIGDDHIVAIGGWRLEGQKLATLNRSFPAKR